MPLIQCSFPDGALTSTSRDALASALTRTILKWERVPDSGWFLNNTWVVFVATVPDGIYAAGVPASPMRWLVEISVPSGALSDRRAAGLVQEATAAVADAAGLSSHEDIWVIVRDVADGRWGAAGMPLTLEGLKQLAAAEAARA